MKSRAWTADTSSLEGVFAQHAQVPPQQPPVDDFGEFHSVSATSAHPVPASMGIAPPSQQQAPSSAAAASTLDTSRFPPVYMEVYRRCSKSGESHLSTELLFPILLSSQLPKNILGDLWAQANQAIPGKLNQMELFVLLGLIGLVQVRVCMQ